MVQELTLLARPGQESAQSVMPALEVLVMLG